MAIGNTASTPDGENFTLKGVLTLLPVCEVTGSVKKKVNKSQAGLKRNTTQPESPGVTTGN